jgi:speckle-type POZ protein
MIFFLEVNRGTGNTSKLKIETWMISIMLITLKRFGIYLSLADRYAMDWLKLVCQRILCEYIDVHTVAATFALADQHNCDKLRTVCIYWCRGWGVAPISKKNNYDKLREVCIEFLEYTASSDRMDAVVATECYASLKRTCPSVLQDMFEKTSRSRKT